MTKSNIDKNAFKFICHMCQFKLLDPLNIPIATILRPTLIQKYDTNSLKNYMRSMNRGKEFIIKENWY